MAVSNKVFLFGYSGHAYVVCDIFLSQGISPSGYLVKEAVVSNPYQLPYCGFENDPEALIKIRNHAYFVAVGNNHIREKITKIVIDNLDIPPCNAVDKSAVVSHHAEIGFGVMVAPLSAVNSAVKLGNGVICNTRSVIEHECSIGHYVHIAPGAILCGNVTIGDHSFIGAGAIVKEGIVIGKNVTVGAGTVVIENVPDGRTVVGNPQRFIK
jgi:sugar O-acyltransferase (sialic acid O-acetyltransferase NeuD family)